MIVLDTDHITELQYRNSVRGARLRDRLLAAGDAELVTTIVTFEEQMRGWLAMVHRLPSGIKQVDAYASLAEVVHFYRSWTIANFERKAADHFQRLRSQKIRINTMDLKIAAIASTMTQLYFPPTSAIFARSRVLELKIG